MSYQRLGNHFLHRYTFARLNKSLRYERVGTHMWFLVEDLVCLVGITTKAPSALLQHTRRVDPVHLSTVAQIGCRQLHTCYYDTLVISLEGVRTYLEGSRMPHAADASTWFRDFVLSPINLQRRAEAAATEAPPVTEKEVLVKAIRTLESRIAQDQARLSALTTAYQVLYP